MNKEKLKKEIKKQSDIIFQLYFNIIIILVPIFSIDAIRRLIEEGYLLTGLSIKLLMTISFIVGFIFFPFSLKELLNY